MSAETDEADRLAFMSLVGGDLAKVSALIAIRSAWSHDPDSRAALDRLIDAGVKVALPKVVPNG